MHIDPDGATEVKAVGDRLSKNGRLSIVPPYLRNRASESGEVIDYRDWHVLLGLRFGG